MDLNLFSIFKCIDRYSQVSRSQNNFEWIQNQKRAIHSIYFIVVIDVIKIQSYQYIFSDGTWKTDNILCRFQIITPKSTSSKAVQIHNTYKQKNV